MSEIIDLTGKPRSDSDIQEAIDCMKTVLIKHALVLPVVTVHAGIIIDCLQELQERREHDTP